LKDFEILTKPANVSIVTVGIPRALLEEKKVGEEDLIFLLKTYSKIPARLRQGFFYFSLVFTES